MVGYGDMRFTDPSVKIGTNPRIRKWLAQRIAEESPEVLLLTGDMPYIGSNDADWQVFRDETAAWRKNQILQFPTSGKSRSANRHSKGIRQLLSKLPRHPEPPLLLGSDGQFDNLDPSLEHAWHPVALSRELRPGGWLQIRLLGRTWTLRRDGGRPSSADPPAFGVRERLGLIWLAPAEPADVALDVPEAEDRRFVVSRPLPVRSPGPAGPLADTFLDATHGPFVHAATIGAPDRTEVVAPLVTVEDGGFSAVLEQWCDNPLDPEVATGGRPLRQRRRTTYSYRAPFQLRLRQEFLDSGATTTILYFLQPEDLDSTRIYLCLLLAAGPGSPLPAPADVAAQVALQHEILTEDVRSQAALAINGLPLDLRDEVHVAADRLGVALRQALCDFAVVGRQQARRRSVVGQLSAAGRAAGRRVLVGEPPAGRADPPQPARRVAALVVRPLRPRLGHVFQRPIPPSGVTLSRHPPDGGLPAGTLASCPVPLSAAPR